jgi:ABC-2 type transport system ATP-binding protein
MDGVTGLTTDGVTRLPSTRVLGAALRIEHVTRRYGQTMALDNVSLELERGIIGLLGPNGAGKTTLLSMLATVASPDSGRLSVLGYDPADSAERVEIRRRLGYLPQDLGYHRHFTVAAFVEYVAILKEITDSRIRHAEVARVLAAAGLADRARLRIRTLSGGMRQRLGLAQALLGQPELLVLDEPAAGLDPERRLRFRELLSELPGDPTVLLATHQVEDVTAVCTQVVVLLAGQVRFTGTPAELAAVASGHVWTADERDRAADLSWRSGDGRWRHVSREVPARVQVVPPTTEDGYLMLSGSAGRDDTAGAPAGRRMRRSGGRP